jgi:hypothetical protein
MRFRACNQHFLRCSYEGCSIPLHLVPEHFSSCLRWVHPICQKFSVGLEVNVTKLLCWVCCKEKADFVTHSDTTAAQASSAQTTQEVRNNARADYARLLASQATLIPQDVVAEEEDDHLITKDVLTEAPNKCGCPIGSTIKICQIQELAQRQAMNVIAIK